MMQETSGDFQEFFVVQRCWNDGPHVEPPLDYMALFPLQRQAEETAYQSAHVHAANHQAVVRTLLLPTGYAFSAAGKLFWVRRVYAPTHYDAATGAHVILTKGVIGGTGNTNSRRGSELTHNRVFVGLDSSTKAMQVLMHEKALPPQTMISWIPMGPIAVLMQGWVAQRHDIVEMAMMEDATAKRAAMDGQSQQHFHYHATSARPAKRHCGSVRNRFASTEGATMDVCTYMST
jgi:hypothetical protein